MPVAAGRPGHAELCSLVLVTDVTVMITEEHGGAMLFLPDDGFEPELPLGDEFMVRHMAGECRGTKL